MPRYENIKFPQDILYITAHLSLLETEDSASETEEFPGIKKIKHISNNKINSLVGSGYDVGTISAIKIHLVFINDLVIYIWL